MNITSNPNVTINIPMEDINYIAAAIISNYLPDNSTIDINPSISPNNISIEAGTSQVFTVNFKPGYTITYPSGNIQEMFSFINSVHELSFRIVQTTLAVLNANQASEYTGTDNKHSINTTSNISKQIKNNV